MRGFARVAVPWVSGFARRICRDTSGLAAIEFALVAPLLSVLLIGCIDAAQVFMTQTRLSAAIYAGVDYALVNQAQVSSGSGASLATTIATIVGNVNGTGWASGTVTVNNGPTATFSGGASTSGGTAANADSYYCLSGTAGSWSWGSSQTNNTTPCVTNGPTAGKFVTITASHAFSPSFLSLGFASGTLSQSVAVQVQ